MSENNEKRVEIEVEVSYEPEEIYLAMKNGWDKGIGHTIRVGEFKFGILNTEEGSLIVEFETGVVITNAPVPDDIEDYAELMQYYSLSVGPTLGVTLHQAGFDVFKAEMEMQKQEIEAQIGPRPPSKTVPRSMFITGEDDQLLN